MPVLQRPADVVRSCRARRGTSSACTVVALSADAEPAATAIVDKHQLGFPVGYGADVDKVADALGCYTNDEPHFLQSSGFLLAPDGTVILASYSSGAIGRLTADDVAGLFRYLASKG